GLSAAFEHGLHRLGLAEGAGALGELGGARIEGEELFEPPGVEGHLLVGGAEHGLGELCAVRRAVTAAEADLRRVHLLARDATGAAALCAREVRGSAAQDGA